MANVMEMCEAVKDYVIEMRRELHKIPELGINNPKTKDFICAQLDEMGIPYQVNTVIHDGVPVSYTHLDVYKRQTVCWSR